MLSKFVFLSLLSTGALAQEGSQWILAPSDDAVCRMDGVFQRVDEMPATLLRFAPNTLKLEAISDENFQAYTFSFEGKVYLNLSLKFIISDNSVVSSCIARQYPGVRAERFSTSEARFRFMRSFDKVDVNVQAGEAIDIFTFEHWISLTVSGRDLKKYFREDANVFMNTLLSGTLEWHVPGEEPIQQSIEFERGTLERVIARIKGTL